MDPRRSLSYQSTSEIVENPSQELEAHDSPQGRGPSEENLGNNKPPQDGELPQDGGLTAWLVVFSCFLLNFNLLGLVYAFGVYQAHYALYVFPHEPPQRISLIGSINISLTLSTGLVAGRVVERFGHRIVAIWGSILFVGSLVAAGFCKTVPALIITQGLLNGLGAGALFIPATAAPAQWFSESKSFVIGLSSAGAGVGGIFWSFITRVLITTKGHHWALWISACISACIYAIALCFLKTRSKNSAANMSLWSGFSVVKDLKFITLFCASTLCGFGYTVPYFYVPSYAELQLQTSRTIGSALSAVLDLGMTAGRIVMGRAADSGLGTMNTIVSAMAFSGLSQFALWLPATNSLPLLFTFAFTYGFFGGGYIGLLPAVLAELFDPDRLPSITGLFYTASQMAGGPIAGTIYTATHQQWTPVILYSGLTLVCGSLFAVITRFQVERRIFASV